MENPTQRKSLAVKELLFQIVLHIIVLIFYALDRRDNHIEFYELVFFANYTLGALFINYFLLPKFFYPKKYIKFIGLLMFTLVAVILIEEMVLEKLFFPDTRGKTFGGLFFTSLNVLPLIMIISGFKFAWDAFFKQREVDELKSIIKESELQFLKSQINPHFLFNNLNNLYSYAVEQSPKTPEIILELSGVLRYMLYECRENYVPLEKEIAQLKNFVSLNEMQIEERGIVKFDVQQVESGYQIAPLILIVFIENAFKHSTSSQPDEISIEIKLHMEETGTLKFVCKNSFQQQSNTDNIVHGIGLENVRKRLNLIYPDLHTLAIQNTDEEYEVHLSIILSKAI